MKYLLFMLLLTSPVLAQPSTVYVTNDTQESVTVQLYGEHLYDSVYLEPTDTVSYHWLGVWDYRIEALSEKHNYVYYLYTYGDTYYLYVSEFDKTRLVPHDPFRDRSTSGCVTTRTGTGLILMLLMGVVYARRRYCSSIESG